MPDYATLYSGLNIEKVSRTATGLHFAVNAYFRQSCESTPWNVLLLEASSRTSRLPFSAKFPAKRSSNACQGWL